MSAQIEKLMAKFPQIFYDVSYEGNNADDGGQGTWLYMRPGWYCAASDCGTIHEYTIKEVMACAKDIYQDKARWIAENGNDTDSVANILAGKYDRSEAEELVVAKRKAIASKKFEKRMAAAARKRKQRDAEKANELVRLEFTGITRAQKQKLLAFAQMEGIGR